LGGFDESLPAAEDLDMWRRIAWNPKNAIHSAAAAEIPALRAAGRLARGISMTLMLMLGAPTRQRP
jgi:hypothetical protein